MDTVSKVISTVKSNIPGLYVGTDKHKWWKEAVVYQVAHLYNNGQKIAADGDPDLPGIFS